MKTRLSFLILAIFLLIVPTATAADDITVIINNEPQAFTPAPVIKNGSTLVPMRGFFEALGAEVSWDGATQTVTGTRGEIEVKLKIGSKTAYVNNQNKQLSIEAQLINGSTYIPLRFVGEALGDTVTWEGSTQTIRISSGSAPPKSQTGKDLIVHFIDVAQGDSILVQTPNGSTMLIDGGPRTAGQKVVSYLKKAGISSIDRIVATHAHEDHIGGLIDVLNNFTVKEVLDVGFPHTTQTYERFLTTIDQKDIKYSNPRAGDTIDLDPSVKISVLNPPGTLPADLNNQSIVLRLTYGTISLLLTGDAERPVEQGLSNAQAQILKAGHHGSSTSTTPEFLKAVNPEIAIISCGKDNSYGHPHQEVLDRLMKANIKIYRTDVSGNIIVKTNGQSYSVSTTPWTDQGTMIIPSPVDQGAYVGSIKSDKYHYPNCRHAESIQPVNKIWFKTKAEAEAKGYVPCKVCKP